MEDAGNVMIAETEDGDIDAIPVNVARVRMIQGVMGEVLTHKTAVDAGVTVLEAQVAMGNLFIILAAQWLTSCTDPKVFQMNRDTVLEVIGTMSACVNVLAPRVETLEDMATATETVN